MKISLIIVGAFLFGIGLLLAFSNPVISVCLTILGLGFFFAGIILQFIKKSKIRKRRFWESGLELIISGIVFCILGTVGYSGGYGYYGYSMVDWICIFLNHLGLLLILFGIVRIIISVVKNKGKR